AFIQKIAKEYKGFAEGEGPPPDPAYSFLADVERDGEKTGPAGDGGGGSPNGNAAILTANGRSPPVKGQTEHHFDRRNPNNRSGHRQGAGGAFSGQSGGRTRVGTKPQHGHYRDHHQHYSGAGGTNIQRSFSTNEHDGWRSATGEQQRRNVRGTTHVTHEGPGHWRRGEQHEGPENHRNKDDSGLLHTSNKLEPNLTVSISRDGEFKSVKVTSPPIIGSGRVGPRQAPKPQFQFHTGQGDHNQPHGQHHLPLTTASAGRKESNQGDHFNRNTVGRKSDRGGESAKKTGPSANSSGKGNGSQPKSTSVQDRLNRNRTMGVAVAATAPGGDKNENFIATKTNPPQPVVSGAAKATLKTISKIIEKNAEIDEKLARELARENEKLATKVKELRLQQEQ
uniref:Uncharacterized protein n=1 Tax=Anopheles maculatus TaxID=74869 RepID=A0A182S687_9DIPT